MAYKFETKGGAFGSRIVDADSGQDVTAQLGARWISIRLEAGKPPIMEAEILLHGEIDGLGRPSWLVRNPLTGTVEKLAGLLFDDGRVADLRVTADSSLGGIDSRAG